MSHQAAPPAAEDQARVILESITDAFFHLDREFRFTFLNATARRLLGRDDLIGKNVWTEYPAARGTVFERAYDHAMFDGRRTDFVAYYPAPLDRWFEVRAYPTQDGVAVYFQDITERRARDEALERSRSQMELVVRGADVGVWHCPLPFDVLLWDEKVKEHFHLPPDAVVTIDTFYERVHPEDRERTRQAIAASVSARTHYDIDYRTLSPDGTRLKWIRAVGRAYYDEDGSPRRFDGVTIDISTRKNAELALEASERRYRLATRATADIVWDWDLDHDHVHWNEALGEQLGWNGVDDTDAAYFHDRVHEDDRARVRASVDELLADGSREYWQCEFRFRRADGSFADVLDRGYVLRDGAGRAHRVVGAMQDLSTRKQVERDRERLLEAEREARAEAERQSRMKDEFLTTVSHELRTPLNAMLGWAQILAGRSLPPDVARPLEVIARNARAQARLVDDLLDMSTMLGGTMRLELQRVDMAALIDAAIETARPMAEARSVHLDRRPSDATGDAHVVGDAGRLQQVLWNLLSNAVKFTPAGGHVTISLATNETQLLVEVSDDGEGIASDFLPFVFERFRQADGSTSRRHGGLGLGLAIVKEVVTHHGGQVRAASPGHGLGSTFTVAIPRAHDRIPSPST